MDYAAGSCCSVAKGRSVVHGRLDAMGSVHQTEASAVRGRDVALCPGREKQPRLETEVDPRHDSPSTPSRKKPLGHKPTPAGLRGNTDGAHRPAGRRRPGHGDVGECVGNSA